MGRACLFLNCFRKVNCYMFSCIWWSEDLTTVLKTVTLEWSVKTEKAKRRPVARVRDNNRNKIDDNVTILWQFIRFSSLSPVSGRPRSVSCQSRHIMGQFGDDSFREIKRTTTKVTLAKISRKTTYTVCHAKLIVTQAELAPNVTENKAKTGPTIMSCNL